MKHFVAAFLCALTLTACAGAPKEVKQEMAPEAYYEKAMAYMDEKNFQQAIPLFEDLERKHPYSQWSTQGKVMMIFAQYEMKRYSETVDSADRFMRLHPGYKDLDYVYYMKAMSYYNRLADVKRDQTYTRKALDVFVELQKRFPNTKYAQDVDKKILLCRDHLAGQEMTVARYYQKQGRMIGAINRYQSVVKEYERTSQVPEALFRMTEVYVSLGLSDKAQQSAAILGHNFPESKWYAKAYDLMVKKELAPVGERASWMTRFKEGLSNLF